MINRWRDGGEVRARRDPAEERLRILPNGPGGGCRALESVSPVAVRQLAHARQLKGLGLYGEDLSRRDLVKVAQYEVLG
jgi:hypothetical protein